MPALQFLPQDPPPLSDTLRAALMAQYRQDLRRDEAVAENLRFEVAAAKEMKRSPHPTTAARLAATLRRCDSLRCTLAELGARV